MSSITINIDRTLKTNVQKKLKKDGVTITFLLTQALKAYNQGKINFGLLPENDDEITASFDVSTKKGKQDCISSFENLCK